MPQAPKLEYPPLILYMIFPAHAWFSTGKINVKLAYTYRGRTKIYILKWGRRTKKFEKPCSGEQTGFDAKKSTVNLVVLLIPNIEDFLEAKKKAGAIFAAVLFQNWL